MDTCMVYFLSAIALLGFASGNIQEDDAQFMTLENMELADSSNLIRTITVPVKSFCALHCNVDSDCTHFTISDSDELTCDLYNSVNRNKITTANGRTSFLRANPPGTKSKEFIKKLDFAKESGSGTIFWRGSAGDSTNNLDMTGIQTVQECYQICLLNTNGACWVFSYSASAKRCVVPDYDGKDMDYTERTALVGQSASGYNYYMYNMDIVNTVNAAEMPELYLTMNTIKMSLGSGVTDMNSNLQTYVPTVEDCYKVCLISNGGSCLVFSWNPNTLGCFVPHDDGSHSANDFTQTSSTDGYYTLFFMPGLENAPDFNAAGWSTLTNLVIRDGQSEHISDQTYTLSSLDLCYKMCSLSVSNCQTFSYNPGTQKCYIADANFHDDWTSVDPVSGCTAYFIKNTGKWKLLTKHREYQGYVPDDSYTVAGSYHTSATATDMAFSNTYTNNPYLKNEMIDYWSSLTTRYRVRLEMYSTGGSLLKYMEYDAGGTSATSWYSSSKFLSSSYSDLTSTVTHNYWSMGSSGRTFYLSRNHGGCENDAGWLSISATVNSGCTAWDYTGTVPMFLYSAGSGSVNWSSGRSHFGVLIIKMSFN